MIIKQFNKKIKIKIAKWIYLIIEAKLIELLQNNITKIIMSQYTRIRILQVIIILQLNKSKMNKD